MGLIDWFRPREPTRPTERSALDAQIADLLSAPPDIAFLVIVVNGSEDDFIQFAASDGYVLIDFPLFTERQRQRESRIQGACRSLGYEAIATSGPDNTRILNCTVPRDVQVLTHTARVLLKEIYGVTDESALEFQTQNS
jgi:hypothetical protein